MTQVKGKITPLCKGGPGGILCNRLKIPLNPPLEKGDFISRMF